MSSVTNGILYVDDYVTTGNGTIPTGNFYGAKYSSVVIQGGGTYTGPITIASGGKVTINTNGLLSGGATLNGGTIFSYASNGTFFSWGSSGGSLVLASGAVDTNENPKAGSASIFIQSGATLSSSTLQSGNSIVVNGGGTLSNTTINAGATAIFSSGANESGVTLNGGTISAYNSPPYFQWGSSGGKLILKSGAVDTGESPQQGAASVIVESGASLLRGTFVSGNLITVNNGGVVSNITLNDFGTLYVQSGGLADLTTVASNGQVGLVGSATNTTINRTGLLEIVSGGVATNTTVVSGQVVVDGGGTLNSAAVTGASINGNGSSVPSVLVSSGATMSNVTVGDWAQLQVSAGGSAINTIINSRGGLGLQGSATGTTINSSGVLDIASGGSADDNTITAGGEIYVASNATLGNTNVGSAGIVSVESGGNISGTITLQAGGSATIWNNAGGSVVLPSDANHGLTISGLENGGIVNTIINGFSGNAPGDSDSIDLAGVSANGVSYAYPSDDQVVITLSNNTTITLNIPGVKNTGFVLADDGSGGSLAEVCFLSGSMIETLEGDIAVEDLRKGDKIISYNQNVAKTVTVSWVGKAHTVVRTRQRTDEAGYPVRIRKDSIADGVPYKDLLVTAEHSLFLNGRFIPARMLINGNSILYDTSISAYDYYHVETEQHSVIRANGTLTESYLDTGNRRTFTQEGPVIALYGTNHSWENDAAAPLCVERNFVEPIYRKLETRSIELFGQAQNGFEAQITDDSGLHLVTDKTHLVRAVRHEDGKYSFMLPPHTEYVHIVSRTSRPSDIIGPFVDDRRELGVEIGDITFMTGKEKHDIVEHLKSKPPHGWYARTTQNRSAWTNGSAKLHIHDIVSNQMGLLTLTICSSGPYFVSKQTRFKEILSA
ncbi:Hint domain-containing protein [Acetobacter indonesiensis]|uniref:Hint domain-containing protein n=1 Tax=Acetobacter indonesiensis TaxID=104101 RepID=UPI000A3CAB8B|nr:Hint domain-containing protein [Acetobacter indonesiensis]